VSCGYEVRLSLDEQRCTSVPTIKLAARHVVALFVALLVVPIVAQSATTRAVVRGVIPPPQLEQNIKQETEMHTNLYLVEKLDRQHHEELAAQAARDRTAVKLSTMQTTRSQIMKRLKLTVAAILVAATAVWAGPRAFTAYDGAVPTVASMCCWIR
jgi:hypothetical protein